MSREGTLLQRVQRSCIGQMASGIAAGSVCARRNIARFQSQTNGRVISADESRSGRQRYESLPRD